MLQTFPLRKFGPRKYNFVQKAILVTPKPYKYMKINFLLLHRRYYLVSIPPKLLLTMKLITFLLMATLSQVTAIGFSQKISMNERNIPIEAALKAIEKQTEYLFLYDKLDLPISKTVTLSIKNATIDQALSQLFQNLPLSYKIFNKNIVIKRQEKRKDQVFVEPVPAIEQIIRGKVTDDKGEALPGVSVLLKGTQSGTTTDTQGNFNIEVKDESMTLIFSFVGYMSQEIIAGTKTTLTVQLLADTKTLSELVVIGYGTIKKADLTGAVGVVSGKQTENQAVASVSQALQGKVAGLMVRQTDGMPGSRAELRIRGMGSFGANPNPLVVVDGIITNGGLTDMDPSSIETVTVLKDASSAAIYGSRGANGVVLVTTKRGKVGKEVINFGAYYSFDRVIHKIGTVDAATYGGMVNDFYVNQGKEAPYADPSSLGKGTNWQDEIFTASTNQNYYMNVFGGDNVAVYALAIGYMNQQGIIKNNDLERA